MDSKVVQSQDWEQMARQAEFKPAKMATLCAMSERHLQRIFKKHLHQTPSQWLRGLQCRLARQLISQGYSSKAAAAELNFATESHFCREFKKIFGTPPQTFAPAHGISLKIGVLDKKTEPRSSASRPGSPIRTNLAGEHRVLARGVAALA
jgi:AraC-like DNA-binding protein